MIKLLEASILPQTFQHTEQTSNIFVFILPLIIMQLLFLTSLKLLSNNIHSTSIIYISSKKTVIILYNAKQFIIKLQIHLFTSKKHDSLKFL